MSLWQVICEPSLYGFKPSKATLAKLGAFKELISGFIAKFVTADAYTLGVEVVKLSGISADIYQDRTPENVARQENVEELLGSIQEFVESRKEEGRVDDVRLTDFCRKYRCRLIWRVMKGRMVNVFR